MSGSTARRVSAYQTMDPWRVDVGATATSVRAAGVNAKTQSHSHTYCPSSILKPHAEMGSENSQSPLWGARAAIIIIISLDYYLIIIIQITVRFQPLLYSVPF